MSVLRNQPKSAHLALFGFGLCFFALIPNEIGYQDIASLLARQPGVAERWQKRVSASAVSSIQVATFNFGRPVGTSVPRADTLLLASLDEGVGDAARNRLTRSPPRYSASDFPRVNRTLKGDRLAIVAPEPPVAPTTAAPQDPSTFKAPVLGAKTATASPGGARSGLDPELTEALNAPPLTQYDASLSPETQPTDDLEDGKAVEGSQPSTDGFSIKTASLYFGSSVLGVVNEGLERWRPGEEPMIVMPIPDPDMKASVTSQQDSSKAGETVVGKGEVKTPAQRLGLLDGKKRAKQEKCLAEAVYFEARGEAVRGQIAVAQVVMNRVFSGYYPTTVCGVVYQNANRRLACQFTFACDGIRDVVTEPDMWDRARRIAKATLDGRLWLPEVGKSTHYHAYWVHPSWVREMKKMYRTGVHTFYRPRAWGDGGDAPSWGTKAQTAEISARLAEAAHSSAELGGSARR